MLVPDQPLRDELRQERERLRVEAGKLRAERELPGYGSKAAGPVSATDPAQPGLARSPRRKPKAWPAWLLLLALAGMAGWVAWVYLQIRAYATHDEARPADAIAVFGAAEYDGRPSPVLRARLDHGLALYQEKLAPLVITLGGGDSSERHSEGGVGKDYLLAHGVPESAIVAETRSSNTRESVERLSAIARANQLHRIVVVSDGTHLFRIHTLCTAEGLTVYTSPRLEAHPLSARAGAQRLMHEVVSYTAFRLHMH